MSIHHRVRVAPGWLLVLLLAPLLVHAAPHRVRAFVQPDHGMTDTQPIRLVVEVSGTASPAVGAPQITGLQNLKLASGRAETSISSSLVNGRFSTTYQLIYTLLPEGPGPARIEGINLQVDGNNYTTEPIAFEIAKGSQRPSATQHPDAARDGADVFVEATLGAEEVWAGQPVTLSATLYAGERIAGASSLSEPQLDAFWVERIEVNPQSDAYRATHDGRTYLAYPVDRKILVPQAAGSYTITPYEWQVEVRVRARNSPFDLFSFGRSQTVLRRSGPLTLVVKPLPDAGRPEGFGGAVGSFSMRVELDRTEARVNDAVALRATVEGEGFLKLARQPRFEPSADFKVLDPEVDSSSRTVRGRLTSRKTWEWIVVPLNQGAFELPTLEFPYFDPATGRYAVATAAPPELAVRRDDSGPDTTLARGEIQLERRDISFIKPLRGELRQASPPIHERRIFVVLAAAPFIGVPLLIWVGRRRARLLGDRGLVRARRARRRARRRLQQAARRQDELDPVRFHQEVARAVVEYVADRFDRSPAGLTYDNADALLAGRDVDLELRRRVRACLETCDFARFVPDSARAERRAEVLEEARVLVDALERAW